MLTNTIDKNSKKIMELIFKCQFPNCKFGRVLMDFTHIKNASKNNKFMYESLLNTAQEIKKLIIYDGKMIPFESLLLRKKSQIESLDICV